MEGSNFGHRSTEPGRKGTQIALGTVVGAHIKHSFEVGGQSNKYLNDLFLGVIYFIGNIQIEIHNCGLFADGDCTTH